jgi:hypothetical protein
VEWARKDREARGVEELADGDDEVDGNGILQGSEEARASKGGWAPMSRTRIPACNSVASIGPFLSAPVGLHARDDCVTAVISREQ